MPPKKKSSKKKKKGKLDSDGLPSYIRPPTTRELILAHQIATTEKEIHENAVDARIYEEKINVLHRQLTEAKAKQQELIRRMKNQADAYRR